MEYNTGNYDKYMTKNPLKRKMVSRLNNKVLSLVECAVSSVRMSDTCKIAQILDAGCGEGFLSSMLKSRIGGVHITGLEYTEEALKIARNMEPEIEFVQGDITNMHFDDASFDIVLCTEVLEHLRDPAAALHELLRVARKAVIITVPHEPWFRMGNMLVMKNLTRFGNPIDHINHWTYSGFESFLKNNSREKWNIDKSFPWTIAACIVNSDAD